MRVLYDETHNQTWTIDPALSVELSRKSNELPIYFSYAHVAHMIKQVLNSDCIRTTKGPLTAQLLAKGDVLFLNHCCSSQKTHLSVGGSSRFNPKEISSISNAVQKGLGLLVLGEYQVDRWGMNINDVLSPFGIQFGDDVAAVSAEVEGAKRSLYDFEATAIGKHAITSGVNSISYHAGCTLALNLKIAQPVISNSAGQVLCAATQFGNGRVCVLGDSDLFARRFISNCDNMTLLINILAWLGGQEPLTPSAQVLHPDSTGNQEEIRQRSLPGTRPSKISEDGCIISIGPQECAQIAELQRNIAVPPHESFEEFLLEAKLAFHEFPRRIRRALVKFSNEGNIDGGLLIRGFPTDTNLPKTPIASNVSISKTTFLSEFWLCCIAGALGEPVGYSQEKRGTIIQNMYPTPQNAEKLSSESSAILLDFHTEIAFHPFLPDYILLYGLRQDPKKEAKTIFAGVRRLFDRLTPSQQDTLYLEQFRTDIDYSYGNPNGKKGGGPLVSVLYGDRLDPFLRYDLDLMVGQTPAASGALKAMRVLVNEVKQSVTVEPGSLLIVDNRRSVHARSKFTANYDGRDRWLQRMSVVRDMVASLKDRIRGTRVINTDFSEYS